MTDLHTHILPGMDDGAANVGESLEMLRAEKKQGVKAVLLTPHFYPEQEDLARFLSRRAQAAELLCSAMPPEEEFPKTALAAEVAYSPRLLTMSGLEQLRWGSGDFLLLELPFSRWESGLVSGLYELMNRTGLTPMLAHIDRYFGIQKKTHIDEILSLGLPVQISAESLQHFSTRGKALKLLRNGTAQIIVSDCHSPKHRSPNLAEAFAVVQRRAGDECATHASALSDRLFC